ncbi:Myogenesis-regulating glycosidase [Frankliniella fusca]|uniref:Myogenesis-regulating glycosidase n=1 Tax=Frankliniella fusca TaxID=407009 RepID=A0AAE1GY79_9NEOP|nr:Myogenesis-regulating glycosidase [Frankliniella fusca]
MTLWLVLLLAAARMVPGSSSPSRTSPLNLGTFTIKDGTGNVLAQLDGGRRGMLGAAAAVGLTDCRRDGDGLQECWAHEGHPVYKLRITPDFCVTATSTVKPGGDGVVSSSCQPLGDAQWYGGGEEIPQKWPLNKYNNLTHSMVTQEAANRGIQDPFWFSSEGEMLFVHPGTPLFVSINDPKKSPGQICLIAETKAPYRKRPTGLYMKYTRCKLNDAKEAYQYAVENFLGKPTNYPDETMIKHPVWSTWARYKAAIDETIVREFAKEIKEYGFQASQLEIDDNWETCYGSKEVNKSRFPNMKQLTDDLRSQGFRVTIWTHPFIQLDCTDTLNEANSKGYLVADESGKTATKWWNGDASIIDFTKSGAQEWFVNRHQKMMEENGIDGFKFDAGETSWMPQLPKLDMIPSAIDEDYPNLATKKYVETCARFNSLTEVRSAYRTQELPRFVRMIDKDSRWGDNNGLKSLVTTLLQMNTVGYPLVLPDMVGGNQYNGEVATSELFVRWLQANTFMPAIQFSLVPWDYTQDKDTIVEISKKFTKLHADYTDVIVAAMKQAVADGTPVNAPIWWLDPTDEAAIIEDSEFLLGESLLSAPVLEEGATTRDVYLPMGKWVDGNTCKKYAGPTTLKDYPAPLDTLPWFYIEGSIADKGGCGGTPAPSSTAALGTLSLSLIVASALVALLAKH